MSEAEHDAHIAKLARYHAQRDADPFAYPSQIPPMNTPPPMALERCALLANTLTKAEREARANSFVLACMAARFPQPAREFVFHPVRKWRFDFAWPVQQIGLEFDGGIWRADRGAHGRPQAILRDMEKGNAAVLLGFKVLRFTWAQTADAIAAVRLLLLAP